MTFWKRLASNCSRKWHKCSWPLQSQRPQIKPSLGAHPSLDRVRAQAGPSDNFKLPVISARSLIMAHIYSWKSLNDFWNKSILHCGFLSRSGSWECQPQSSGQEKMFFCKLSVGTLAEQNRSSTDQYFSKHFISLKGKDNRIIPFSVKVVIGKSKDLLWVGRIACRG